MRDDHKLFTIIVFAAALIGVGLEAPVAAYVDPGTGALLLQALAGIALGSVYYFRKALFGIASIFTRRRQPHPSDTDHNDAG